MINNIKILKITILKEQHSIYIIFYEILSACGMALSHTEHENGDSWISNADIDLTFPMQDIARILAVF